MHSSTSGFYRFAGFSLAAAFWVSCAASDAGLAQATNPGVRQVRIPRALVVASEDVQIPAKAAGQIVDLKVNEGDRVETGSILAVIDDELSQRRKETAEAEFEAAKAQAESDAEVRSADARARYYAEEYAVNEKLKQGGRQPKRTPQDQGPVGERDRGRGRVACEAEHRQVDAGRQGSDARPDRRRSEELPGGR